MATSVKDVSISPAAPILLEELPFVRARLGLITPQSDAVSRQRSQDRTVGLVRKWKVLSENLPMIRSSTLSALEVVEGKAGAVSLQIFDRPKYDAIQSSIRETSEEITKLEQAMRELDGMHAGFLSELHNTRSALSGVENQQHVMLGTWAAAAIRRGANSRNSVEDILATDQIYQSKKSKVDSQISNAKENLAKVLDQIAKIEGVLDAVGC